ncbi:MAG: YqiA/YcfP family alpha/beta fold hydrolase [Myxococcota bacterium]|nr:YqiA/YcfP family alpha/beta fold hydrolase [Myxococcota bacterium]
MKNKYSYPPEDDELYELVNLGLSLFHNGYVFEAHELWEYAWYDERGRTRLLLQALIQISAALHKHKIGVPAGTCKLLAKSLNKIKEVKTACKGWMGIDLDELETNLENALQTADDIFNGLKEDLLAPRLPSHLSPDRIIYLHGFASSPKSKKAGVIVTALQQKGYDVVVPDQNAGNFSELTVSRSVDIVRRLLADRNVIIGSSLGGYIASLVAAKDDRVKGLVLMAPAFDFFEGLKGRHSIEDIQLWQKDGFAMVDHYGTSKPEKLSYGFFEDAKNHQAYPVIRVPTYILHGNHDETVDVRRSARAKQMYEEWINLDCVEDDHSLINSVPRALNAAQTLTQKLQFRPAYEQPSVEAALATLENDERFKGKL